MRPSVSREFWNIFDFPDDDLGLTWARFRTALFYFLKEVLNRRLNGTTSIRSSPKSSILKQHSAKSSWLCCPSSQQFGKIIGLALHWKQSILFFYCSAMKDPTEKKKDSITTTTPSYGLKLIGTSFDGDKNKLSFDILVGCCCFVSFVFIVIIFTNRKR